MTGDEVYAVAESLCMPLPDELLSSYNYWNFYVPTAKQWRAGERWVRCDALIRLSIDPDVFHRWAGPAPVGLGIPS